MIALLPSFETLLQSFLFRSVRLSMTSCSLLFELILNRSPPLTLEMQITKTTNKIQRSLESLKPACYASASWGTTVLLLQQVFARRVQQLLLVSLRSK
eukprot:3070260-Amphidinium_carterae.1